MQYQWEGPGVSHWRAAGGDGPSRAFSPSLGRGTQQLGWGPVDGPQRSKRARPVGFGATTYCRWYQTIGTYRVLYDVHTVHVLYGGMYLL
jgi:hypothetical protein